MTTKNELFEIIGLYCLEYCRVNVSLCKECNRSRYASPEVTGMLSRVFRSRTDPLVSDTEDLDEPAT